jgi:Fe-S-cluster-containing dehydrogenase component
MGASVALAGAATIPGCRRPDHKIMSFSKDVPEDIIPGKPLFYATSIPVTGALGGAEGLLVETHEGRPTKIEGNPLHPLSNGKSTLYAQASILQMYDPDRLKYPIFKNPARGKVAATWDDFRAWSEEHLKSYEQNGGAGLAFLVEKKTSPSRDAARDAVLKKFPKATWVAFDPVEPRSLIAGSEIAFGKPMRAHFAFDKARTILSLDADFLRHDDAEALPNARSFAKSRAVYSGKDQMSRLYVVESGLSLAGGQADHRQRLSPAAVAAFAVELARFMLPKLAGDPKLAAALADVKPGSAEKIDRAWLEACASDLLQGSDVTARSHSVVVPGATLPAEVVALVHALNAALGSKVVTHSEISAENAGDSGAAIRTLSSALGTSIKTLVCINTNPLYTAPGDANFAAGFAKLDASITLTVESTETAAASTWALNSSHSLESWGDAVSADGVIAPIQPMIAPLYEPAMSEIELLAFFAGQKRSDGSPMDGYEIVRSAWKARLGAGDFDRKWKRALHDGVVAGTGGKTAAADVNFAAVAGAISAAKLPADTGLAVVFHNGYLLDGKYANNPWLQELSQFGTAVCWDNPALVSPATALKLGIAPEKFDSHPEHIYLQKYPQGRIAKVELNGRAIEIPVWVMPGMADDTIILTVGYGRKDCGAVGEGVGVNVFPLRSSDQGLAATGAKATPTGAEFPISSTQMHWSMEGRTAIVRAVDLPVWAKYGDGPALEHRDDIYERVSGKLSLGEKLGELAHSPPNISIYANPQNGSVDDPDPKFTSNHKRDRLPNGKPAPADFTVGPQWGMTIDLTTCTGCHACTIACQAENNIAVVGKKEVAKGREMSWIRVDRYFVGDDYNNPEAVLHQPVACVHCENAPCETVCPVNATVHSPEGHNMMTYNRCIGTRYCANNCPYKVRRFNFFEYGLHKFNGGWVGREFMQGAIDSIPGKKVGDPQQSFNPNLIPPRLREKLDEISRMQKNPDVTVRMRGIMEKCSYCVQRTNYAKIECKLSDIKDASGKSFIPDGFVQTACQQSCPSDSIVFGDILDPKSKVSQLRQNQRSYLLLGYLNTRPRTSHLIRVNNPNPALVSAERKAAWEHPFGHHGAGHGDGHGDGHDAGHDSHSSPEGAKHGFLFNPNKRRDDRGYALSLNVLSSQGMGVNA